jgi:hypothetical protein
MNIQWLVSEIIGESGKLAYIIVNQMHAFFGIVISPPL